MMQQYTKRACSFFCTIVIILTFSLLAQETIQAETKIPLDRAVQNLKYTQDSLESEMSKLEQKIQNQEIVLESMREEVTSLLKACKDSQKSMTSSQDSRLKGMEKNIEKLISDLKQFKTHANETSTFQSSLQKKVQELSDVVSLQGQQLHDLESAIRSLALALQGKAPSDSKSDKKNQTQSASKEKAYRVKSGDTLEKIAKDQAVSLQALKERNNLQNDKIVPGQELKIP